MRPTTPLLASAALFTLTGASHASHHAYDSRLATGDPVGTTWRATEHFDALETLGPDRFDFATGRTWQISAEGDSRAVAALRFYVEDGELTVGRQPDSPKNIGKAMVHVTAPALREAGHAGSGSLDVDRLTGKSVGAQVAGSGTLAVRSVSSQALKASIAGSGRLTLAGRSDSARISIAGSGRLDGRRFVAGRADASLAGSGDAEFGAQGAVKASIVGSGDVVVNGTTDCKASRIGSGRLRCSG